MRPDDESEAEEALRRVMAAALIVGQAKGVLHDRVQRALAVGADPAEVLRTSGLARLPFAEPTDDEMPRRRRRARWAHGDTDDRRSGHAG